MTKQGDGYVVSTKILIDDYDSPWKEAVEHYFLLPFRFCILTKHH